MVSNLKDMAKEFLLLCAKGDSRQAVPADMPNENGMFLL
jgi:hypothetical protein